MKLTYFKDTQTLLIELRNTPVVSTQTVAENATIDVDANDNICAITVEHVAEHEGAAPEIVMSPP